MTEGKKFTVVSDNAMMALATLGITPFFEIKKYRTFHQTYDKYILKVFFVLLSVNVTLRHKSRHRSVETNC